MNINITLKLPIINGFVSIPDHNNKLPPVTPDEVIAEIPTAYVESLPFNENKTVWGYKSLVLPSYTPDDGPASDFYQTIRNIALAKLA